MTALSIALRVFIPYVGDKEPELRSFWVTDQKWGAQIQWDISSTEVCSEIRISNIHFLQTLRTYLPLYNQTTIAYSHAANCLLDLSVPSLPRGNLPVEDL